MKTLLVLFVFIAACTPEPTPDTPSSRKLEIPSNETIADVCANLTRLGCHEGTPDGGADSCVVVLARTRDLHLTDMNASCVQKAVSKNVVRACGPFWKSACL